MMFDRDFRYFFNLYGRFSHFRMPRKEPDNPEKLEGTGDVAGTANLPGVELLPIFDKLDRAMHFLDEIDLADLATEVADFVVTQREGIDLIRDSVIDVLGRVAITPMNLVGKPFDPQLAEAVAEEDTAGRVSRDHVISEQRKGFVHGEAVLRPARVVVSIG